MSFKSLFEKFGDSEDLTTSPFDFQKEMTIIAVPQQSMQSEEIHEEEPSKGTVLQMPEIPNTHTVEVVEAPETFKGELGHLTPEEHQIVVDWFDKASVDPDTPVEVRLYLVQIALDLKMDAKKRIVPTEKKVDGE